MNPDRRAFIVFSATAVYAVLLLIVLLLPSDSIPKLKILSIDKLWHLLSYFLLTMALMFSFREGGYRNWYSMRFSFIIPMAHAGITEILQAFVPGRSANFGDWIANCLGIGLAILGYRLFPDFFEKRK